MMGPALQAPGQSKVNQASGAVEGIGTVTPTEAQTEEV
jgi:hypothetical protein